MSGLSELSISIGQHSAAGRKEINQDFYGVCIPRQPHLSSKGITMAVADGISSSDVSQIAAQAAVTTFLEDYFCTAEAWSVTKSVQRVLHATNAWLHSQTCQSQHRFDKDRGYVCTLSAMVLKSTTAHIFHVGDSRIYRLRAQSLEQLTQDHRISVSQETSYLSRALGMGPQLEIDYQAIAIELGDVYFFATDGVYEHVNPRFVIETVKQNASDLDQAARLITEEAFKQGSPDNLTAQLARVDELPDHDTHEIHQQAHSLPVPPALEARMLFDGYRIIRQLQASSRSHVFLAIDSETDRPVVLKTPSVEQHADPVYLERFLMEEWIARRINSPYVLKPCPQTRQRNFLYVATEYVEGQTLAQWMIDHPKPSVELVRSIVDQIAKGLRAFHRLEMLHQDLKPDNVLIDRTGTVKIIDFGSTRVAGVQEKTGAGDTPGPMLGAEQYSAPEYFLGHAGSPRADLFSLGVIMYQMLSAKLPYGAQVPKAKTLREQRKLRYRSLLIDRPEIPAWIDETIRKALDPDPAKRYADPSEFTFDLHHPNKAFLNLVRTPLIERNPAVFWQVTSFVLALVVLMLLNNVVNTVR